MIPPAPDGLDDADVAYALIMETGAGEVLLAVSRDRDAVATADRVTSEKVAGLAGNPGGEEDDRTFIRRIPYVRPEVAEEHEEK